jgi:hypothetical protein
MYITYCYKDKVTESLVQIKRPNIAILQIMQVIYQIAKLIIGICKIVGNSFITRGQTRKKAVNCLRIYHGIKLPPQLDNCFYIAKLGPEERPIL